MYGHTLQLARAIEKGAQTIPGGKGELEPTPEDLDLAGALGSRIAGIAAQLKD